MLKATVSSIMSVRLFAPVCSHATLGSNCTDFHDSSIFCFYFYIILLFIYLFIFFFLKSCRENFTFDQNLKRIMGTLYKDLGAFVITSTWILLEQEMFQKVVKKKHTFICSITFLLKTCWLWDNVGRYGRASLATDGLIMRRRKAARIQTHNYCFVTATMVKRTRSSVAL